MAKSLYAKIHGASFQYQSYLDVDIMPKSFQLSVTSTRTLKDPPYLQ